ncbi:hypothetical protein [Streptomyces sp. NBC_01803]|uniref:hypothetical protein n=1 Tax=Streptomyces sp. NBC_01803 TaxID=2975946 RepID=UPI002DD9C47B|nr:hypothetical protein [Streptomyces sp. NBC_01803]WSA45618.1 hypothetical protein OIE51_16260 [Streptomyces sp. NBC_01803]
MSAGQEPEYVFDQVQIGKGVRPLAQHGFVVIDGGVLTLLGSDRQLIDSAPLTDITAAPIRFTRGKTLAVTVNGTKYSVSPGWGRHVGFPIAGTTGDVKTAAQALLRLIESAGTEGA